MKVMLILMTILQIKLFLGNFTGLFKSDKIKVLELNDSMSEALVISLTFIYTLFLTLYYILAGIYVNQIVFTILSCLFVIQSWKSMWTATNWVIEKDDNILKTTFISKMGSIVNLIYIGYLIYYLIVS